MPPMIRPERKLIKILYIDPSVDEKSSSKMLEDSTAHLSYTCVFTVVSNAFIALECTEHTCYQLIIARKTLIDLHAIDMMKILDAVGASTPVVVLIERGEDYNPVEMQGLRLYLDVLRRPFCTADLCRIIQAAVNEMDNPRMRALMLPPNANLDANQTATTSNSGPSQAQQLQARSRGSQQQRQLQQQQQGQPSQQYPAAKRVATNTSQMSQSHNNMMSGMNNGSYKNYPNSTNNLSATAFPLQEMHRYDLQAQAAAIAANSARQHVFANHSNELQQQHGNQYHPNQPNLNHMNIHGNNQQGRNFSSRTNPPTSTASNPKSSAHRGGNGSNNQGNDSLGNHQKTEELLRWKECIQVYSQELNASLSGMFQSVVSTESAGSLNGNNNNNRSQQQQCSRSHHNHNHNQNQNQQFERRHHQGDMMNTSLYDHQQAALGIASLAGTGNSGISHQHSFSMYHNPPQQASNAEYHTLASLEHAAGNHHGNNHSSADEGGTSTSSSVEDFPHNAAGSTNSYDQSFNTNNPRSSNTSESVSHTNSQARKRCAADM